ncbi:PspC domain-containing protein [Sinomonas terrae]|uniref:PspC domain-containing protein n=1 Tax=Sinomonas terrae TaxID=2908838 RepID=A0ABS9TXX5_9MICC|nr:PspC domain-containing protein [Sinomonas terrae]MCH6469274.1 PspC domain-containing protein [Sinomonas terrae]
MSTEQTPGGSSPAPSGQPHGKAAGSDFFGWVRRLRVTRGSDRWAGGVASGLAHRWGVDPVVVRGLFIVAAIFLGVGVLAYGVLWLLLPEPDGRIHCQEAMRGRWTAGMTGGLIATILGLGGARAGFWFGDLRGAGPFWALFWIGAAALAIFSISRSRRGRRYGWYGYGPSHHEHLTDTRTDAGTQGADPSSQPAGAASPSSPYTGGPYSSTPYARSYQTTSGEGAPPVPGTPPAPRATAVRTRRPGPGGPFAAVVVGVAVLVSGGLLALQTAGVTLVDPSTGALWAIGAAVLGLGIVVAGLRGRSGGILSFLAVVALAIAATTQPAYELSRSRQVGNFAPASVQQAQTGYHITAAAGQLDLSRLDSSGPLSSTATVPVDATMSQLQIRIPKDVPVRVEADATMSNVQFGDKSIAGIGTNGAETYNAGRTGGILVVTVHATMSNVNIQQER